MKRDAGFFFAMFFVTMLAGLTILAMGGHDYNHALYSPETAFHPLRGRIEIGVGTLLLVLSGISFVIFLRRRP